MKGILTPMDEGKNQEAVDSLIDTGSNMAGGAAGAAMGFFTGGPVGAVAGAIAGPAMTAVFRRVGTEIKSRLLGRREEVRAGAAIAHAGATIRRRLEAGEQLRSDGFFDEPAEDRAPAEEIAEKTILSAQRDPEEKKTQFYGIALGNLAFTAGVGRTEANQILTLFERLSFRQLCLIRIFQDSSSYNLRSENYREEGLRHERLSLLHEVYELYRQGILHASGKVFLGIGDVNPSIVGVQGMAQILTTLAELNRIEGQDLEEVASFLR